MRELLRRLIARLCHPSLKPRRTTTIDESTETKTKRGECNSRDEAEILRTRGLIDYSLSALIIAELLVSMMAVAEKVMPGERDPEELEPIREGVEALLSSLKNVRICYTELDMQLVYAGRQASLNKLLLEWLNEERTIPPAPFPELEQEPEGEV